MLSKLLRPVLCHYPRYKGRQLLYRMLTSSSQPDSRNPLIGVCQLTCTADKRQNFQTAKSLIERASSRGAKMIFLPEAADYIGESKSQSIELAETLEGETISKYRELAQRESVWLSVGGFHQKSEEEKDSRVLNTHVIIDDQGQVRDTYSKTHLFDLDLEGRVRLCESDYTIPGKRVTSPVKTSVGNVGMEICYDLRFPELSLVLAQQGADILTFPSAFTVTTGMAHWEVLLRSRAIETQCYVVAAAQSGKHNSKRSSYGHSMVIDPWGTVIAQCSDGVDVCFAEINLDYIQKIREEMPVTKHRRPDLYGVLQHHSKGHIDETPHYQFGQHSVGCQQVFYKTALSFAFVNIKPVLPGHVLVSSLRPAKRFSDLTPAELADLSLCVQKVCGAVEKHFCGTSVTIAIQDGPDSGQTVEHVHVHILPRKPGDLPNNDDIYRELAHHDKDIKSSERRSEEEMNREAASLRPYFL
ncbi:nitrilase and fragile histidine triad fusion protein NitFhit-like [Ostrea edulis]|uniref:nitrilase and fragile histidine triad fusion protein NitFhit-like n=1 Tax=Ostrea edulis TaxID=37623 RepID=UPI0024AFDE92|nr:nitrilase and fragile histidine triad fusion protein NitFhit-like [Ostrea edulis]XP_055999829.1 nitrilase and fragile histidine triad fusion protein NitFhit-like [Ostrea edulis]XP_055999830.1 nitrilase and fragile histidine triad fusion protein NitFhit-like [Ostrea edulis]